MKLKWRLFLPAWLGIILLAPSIWFHRLWIFNKLSPGSETPSPPLFLPFGTINYICDIYSEVSRGIARGDFDFIVDVIVIFISLILPIMIYTFFIALGIYYLLMKLGLNKVINKE